MNDYQELPLNAWLPITKEELEKRNWEQCDAIIVTGDAYVDHPAFGAAVVGRLLESKGMRVAILALPNWRDDLRDFKKLGKPKYFFGVTSGNMDSMVNHYTAGRRLRSDDAYSPGGQAGLRPNYATTVYCKILKKLYPDTPVIIGGIEASLRRVTHYDYWQDKLFPSILEDSGADLLVYGMGDLPILKLADLMMKGVPFKSLKTVLQTAFILEENEPLPKNKDWKDLELASHQDCLQDKIKYAKNFRHVEQESNKHFASRLIQKINHKTLIINPPFPTMNEKEIDTSFDLPYTRLPHPKYKKRGSIPAYEMIKFSLNMHRGCFGGCSFCTISAHQGKFVASRSQQSILKEVDAIVKMPDYKGVISDLGGPSANMYKMKGIDQSICDKCAAPSCIHPTICRNLDTNHSSLTEIYSKVRKHPQVKKAFVGSGVRYDLLFHPKGLYLKESDAYIDELVGHHVSGRLKVAPEHTENEVLKLMRKPKFDYFLKFKKKFEEVNNKYHLKQEMIPYFISSHPLCREEDMVELALKTKKLGYKLEQVQDFTPTPMTLATEIYYSGYHPYTLKKVYCALSVDEKTNQRKFFFWYKEENKNFIRNKLAKLKKFDILAQFFKV